MQPAYVFSLANEYQNERYYTFIPVCSQKEFATWENNQVVIPAIKAGLLFTDIFKPEIGKPVKWHRGDSSFVSLKEMKQLKPIGKFNIQGFFNVNYTTYLRTKDTLASREELKNLKLDTDTTFQPLSEQEQAMSGWDLIQSEYHAYHRKNVYVVLNIEQGPDPLKESSFCSLG